MKTLLYLLLVSISFQAACPASEKAEPDIKTWDASRDFGVTVQNGVLVYQTAIFAAGRQGAYYYKPKNGGWMALSSSLGALNYFLKEEIDGEAAISFLHNNMPKVLVATMASGAKMIDPVFVERFKGGQRAKITKYQSNVRAVVEANTWGLTLNVATLAGGVERWNINGGLSPLRIYSFTREVLEIDGTFKMPREIGAQ